MIMLLAYWYVLLWNVNTGTFHLKEFFCTFSTFELVGEMVLLVIVLYGVIEERKFKQ